MIQKNTLFGFLAILLWSTTIGVSRSLIEQVGQLAAGASIYLLAGGLGLLFMAVQGKPGGLRQMLHLPRRYLFGCGGLFVAYIVLLNTAVGLAANGSQVVVVGMLNYLWPALSLLFAVKIFAKRVRPWFLAGMALALLGLWLALSGGESLSIGEAFARPEAWAAYGSALVAAVAWALYSNLARKWGGAEADGAVPLFLLASGLLLASLYLLFPGVSHWSPLAGLELVYMAALPGFAAYVLWELAMRRGNMVGVIVASYLTPLLSTLVSVVVLGVRPSPLLWLAAFLLAGGAALSKSAVLD